MSLDVYLTRDMREPRAGTGIFVRDNGRQREITREEWDARFPGVEPVTLPADGETGEVYSRNITHNLNRMAEEAGLHKALWRPAELDPQMAARIREQEEAKNYHGAGGVYELERSVITYARDLIEPMAAGLARLHSEPDKFKALNPPNGWGTYEGLIDFVTEYLAACREWPDARVVVSR